eukprot:14933469-Heterocapsa_arctica.AAC.1
MKAETLHTSQTHELLICQTTNFWTIATGAASSAEQSGQKHVLPRIHASSSSSSSSSSSNS